MRKDPPFDLEYVTSTWLLEMAEREGARVFNDPARSATTARSSRSRSSRSSSCRRSSTRLEGQLQRFIDEQADVVLKPLEGHGGASVFRVTDRDANRNVIIETLTAHGTRSIMAQRYIPEIRDGDKRVLLIAGQPVPYSLARIPKPGESRGNLAAGGTGVARPLGARDREIAEHLGPVLWRRGLLLVGTGRHRRLAHRSQRHQPDLLPGDRPADGIRRGRDVLRRARGRRCGRLGRPPGRQGPKVAPGSSSSLVFRRLGGSMA